MSTEEEKPPSPPPLLAYTVSQQQLGKGKGKTAKKTKSGKQVIAPIRRKRPAEPILFDEENRREFLTGFRKRKQARIETVRKKALEREKEERRRSRAETRKARLEQAAENVRMEKIAYGNGEEDDDDDEEDHEPSEHDHRDLSPSAYETEEHHTTVTVQEWNPEEEEENANTLAKEKAAARMKKLQDSLPPSSRRAAKKLKNATKQSIPPNGKRLADPRKISKLLDADESIEVPTLIELENSAEKGKEKGEGEIDEKKKKQSKFYYESKLERAKAKAKIKENKLRWAERRKEERLEANKHDRNRMRKGGKAKKKK